jgi:hypothetical protein
MMEKDWPKLLRIFNEELGYSVRYARQTLGFELFTIDLSSWKLRLSNYTPVIWVRITDLDNIPPQELLQSLGDVLRERNWGRQIALVLVDGNIQSLLRHRTSPIRNLVFIGADEQKNLIASRRPSGALRDIVSAQVPISNLSPYETRAPVTGSRFFGRDAEVTRIISNPDTNHTILGIRRIGKTSLLREIERILKENEDPAHVVYLECSDLLSTEDYTREVVRKLNPRELPRLHMQKYIFFFPDFLERMSRMLKSKLVFLLDEVDNLVIMQRGDWELFSMLRASANKGACQYIIAGFREAMKEQYLLDSPFYNFSQEIRLNEFSRQQAHELITVPMENLRVHFKGKEEVVSRIYDETAGQPNLIQYYCLILLRQLDFTGQREISPESLFSVYGDEGFRSHLLTSFMQNTENREKALVYALLAAFPDKPHAGFTQEVMDEALRKGGVSLLQADLDEACNVLTLAGVIHRKGREFFFASPVFTKVLGESYDLAYLFRKVKEEGL